MAPFPLALLWHCTDHLIITDASHRTAVYFPGYLDPCSESENLVVGAQLELPMWLANSLGARRKRTVTVDLPKQYKEVYREILNADATVVNLHTLGPHYYAFGRHLLEFEHTERRAIAESMQKVSS